MKHVCTIITVAAAACALLCGCGGQKGLKARKSYDIGEYDRAEKFLKSAAAGEKNKYLKSEYQFFLGECYRIKNQPKKAAGAYGRAIRYKYPDNIALLRMADCYRAAADYPKAVEAYEQYLKIVGSSPIAENGLASCRLAAREADADAATYIISKEKAFSSKYSDYAPCFASDDNYEIVYFTSMRTDKKARRRNRVTGQGNSAILTSKIDGKGEWTEPEKLGEPFSSTFDDGTPSLTADGKTMFFTRCPYDPTKANTAEVYESTRSGGRWSDPVRVVPGGDSTMMVAHPAIAPDGRTLYFVSDADGGIGGKDIYRTTRTESGWSPAENMGAIINTQGDEMFPFVRADGTLYFCSNGQVGYGGLDIFRVERADDGSAPRVINLGQPINSTGDDFGICFKGNADEGLFSSSRAGTKGIDDIYSFVLQPVEVTLEGAVTLADGKPAKGAFVRIVSKSGINERISPAADGSFALTLERDTEYILMVGAPGCFNSKVTFSTFDIRTSKTLTEKITLRKVE